MFPILLIAQTPEKIDAYISEFISNHKYEPYSIFKIVPPKKEIIIDQVRQVKKQLQTSSPQKRLFIFSSFDTAAAEAQNALLKTLEEQGEQNQFMFIVSNLETVLPTIQSRSKIIYLEKASVPIEMNEVVKTILDALEKNKDYSFLSHELITSITRDEALQFFDDVIHVLKEKLSAGNLVTTSILKRALKVKALLLTNNLNAQLSVDSFLIFVKKSFSLPQGKPNKS